jgi:hypothetical protein
MTSHKGHHRAGAQRNPVIHLKMMDCRVKPGNDSQTSESECLSHRKNE